MIEFGMIDVGGPISSYGKVGEWVVTPSNYVAPIVVEQEEVSVNTNSENTEEVVTPEGNGGGVIAGIVISVIFFVLMIGLAIFFLKKRKGEE